MTLRVSLSYRLAAFLLLTTHQVAAQDIRVDSNVAIPMRDGVLLRADIFHPAAGGRHPTLVYRTPYNKRASEAAIQTARKAVARGYVVVMQDVRGRYASDGEFLPYEQEGRDGYDTIEWAAKQPWSTGQVGTYGLSYPGAVQWLAAIENPPSLKAMAPAMTFASPMQFWYSRGVWDNSWIGWINANIAEDRLRRLGEPPPRTQDSSRATGPICASVDECERSATFRRVAPWYFEWKKRAPYDPWWSWADLSDKYGRTNAAVLNLSGWYDEAYGPDGATKNHAGLVAARRGTPARTSLIMGPWVHGVPRPARVAAGERVYGAAGVIDYDETVLRWMDRHVRDMDNGVDREKPVRVFVLGSNRWIESDQWPLAGIRPDTILLRRSGSSTTIVSDPAKPVVDEYNRPGAHDYRALAQRNDVVIFETPPLTADKTVVGALRAEIFVSVDAPDTDLWVKVFDVAPGDTAFNLMSPGLDVVRASYRNGRRELLEPGRVYRLDLPDLLTANTFRQGHRIRVAVMTSFAPGFAQNPHTGDVHATPGAARTARVTIHHDPTYPSRLILPTLRIR